MQHIPVLEDWSWHHFSTVVAQLQYIPHHKQSSRLSHPSAWWNKITITAPLATRNMHVHHVPHAEHVEGSIRQNGEVWSRRRHAVLCLSCSQVSERNNCINVDKQVVSCHCYLVIFHPFVELLTVFYICGLIFWPAVFYLSESSASICGHCKDIMSGMCQKGK